MAKASRAAVPKSGLLAKLEQQAALPGRAEFGASSALPALSVCRLEAPEDLLRKLQQHVDDPALADFTCPICWDPFWQPVRTVCGHAFCEGCLLKAVLAQLNHQQPDVSCPLCRHPLHVDDVSVDQALLTRIRSILTERGKDVCTPRRGSGRVYRGLAAVIHGGTGTTATATPSASSSASAAGPVAPRPRTSPSQASSASAGSNDLEGLAVTVMPNVSGGSSGHSSRAAGGLVQRGLHMRTPRTAPTSMRGSDEGLTGIFPQGWFQLSASAPCGRPETSPAVSGFTRDSMALVAGTSAVVRPPTAPEGTGGRRSSARSRPSGCPHAAAHGPLPATPSRRVQPPGGSTSPHGFEPLPGVVVASDAAPAPGARRCGWGPAPAKPGASAKGTGAAPSAGQSSSKGSAGHGVMPPTTMSGSLMRNCHWVRRRHGGSSVTANGRAGTAPSATPAGSAREPGAMAEGECTGAAVPQAVTSSLGGDEALHGGFYSEEGDRFGINTPEPPCGQVLPAPVVKGTAPAGFLLSPSPTPRLPASPPSSVPACGGVGATGTGTWTAKASPQAMPALGASFAANAPDTNGIEAMEVGLSVTHQPSSSARPDRPAAPKLSRGSVARDQKETPRFPGSTSAALASLSGRGTASRAGTPAENLPRGGPLHLAPPVMPPGQAEPGCSPRGAYAADFAFADRYRQLLEEGA